MENIVQSVQCDCVASILEGFPLPPGKSGPLLLPICHNPGVGHIRSAIGKHERSKSVGKTLLRLGLDEAASCYGSTCHSPRIMRPAPSWRPSLFLSFGKQSNYFSYSRELPSLRRTGSNDTACDACARVACRIGLVIIGCLVNHQSRTSFLEEWVWPATKRDV